MPASNTIDILSPDGQLGTIPAENAAEAMKEGFTTPSPEMLKEHAESKIYGNHTLLSGLQGISKGALPFGAGVKLAETLGVPTEVQEKLAKYNPTSNAAGEIAGMLAPTGLFGIAGKASKLAKGLVGLEKLGEEVGTAAKIVSHVVGGAAEGATFGASKVAEDAVMGDPNLVAQHALSEIGTQALWGAGISGGLGLASVGFTKGLPAANKAMAELGDVLGVKTALKKASDTGKEAYATAASFVSGTPKSEIYDAFKNMGKHEVPGKSSEVSTALQKLHETVDSTLKGAAKETEGFTSATNEAVDQYLSSVDSIKKDGEFAKSFMYKSKDGLKVDPSKVESFIKMAQKEGGQESEHFASKSRALNNYLDASNDLLNQLEKEGTLGAHDGMPDIEGIRNLVEKNKSAVDAAEQSSMAKAVQGLRQAHGLGEFLGIGAVGHMLGVPGPALAAGTAAIEALRNPIETINRLAKLQHAVSSSVDSMNKLATSLAANDSKIGSVLTGLSAVATKKQYDKTAEEIENHSQNLEGLTDKLHANTAVLAPHAPAIVDAMQSTAGRAISFLASKVHDPVPAGPLAKKTVPSTAQMSKFNKYYEAVTNPRSVLKAAKNGTLTSEAMEAMNVVHPQLLQHMRAQVLSALTNNKKAVSMPYQNKLMLSLFLGQDVDGSTNPVSMHMNQAMLELSGQQAEAKEQAFIGQPKPTQKGLSNISSSEQALTAQQKSSQRK